MALRGAHLPLVAAKEVCLNEPTARTAQGTLLLIGSGVLADSLAKDLTGKGSLPERATSARAAATAATEINTLNFMEVENPCYHDRRYASSSGKTRTCLEVANPS